VAVSGSVSAKAVALVRRVVGELLAGADVTVGAEVMEAEVVALFTGMGTAPTDSEEVAGTEETTGA